VCVRVCVCARARGCARAFVLDTSAVAWQYVEYPAGMKMNSVSSAVREVATRMNEVRLGHQHKGHLMAHQHLDDHLAAEYAQRGGDVVGCMHDGMHAMGAAAQMMRAHGHGGHDGKMQHGYGGGMLMNLGGHLGRGGMPFIAAQPPCLPFAMHAGAYGGASMPGVAGGGMGGAASGLDMMHRSAGGPQAAKHNKYCHFCQHVKVRASGMLACCNKDCTRRFCEHCLSKSIGDDVNPQTSAAWVNGQWHCPVCRKLCCCAIGDCDKNHRHCKAYRYRVRRAEQQAVKRAGTTGGGEGTSPRDTAQGEGATSCSGVKAEQAVEISDDKGASQETAAAVREAIAQAKSTAMAAEPGKLAPPGHACVDAAQDRYGARVKAEARQDEPALAAPSAAAAPSASGAMSPSMVHRMRHGRAPGSAAGAGAGALDLNDVNTMADSWLRLLEVPPPPSLLHPLLHVGTNQQSSAWRAPSLPPMQRGAALVCLHTRACCRASRSSCSLLVEYGMWGYGLKMTLWCMACEGCVQQEEEDAEELSGFIHGGGPSGRGGGGSESGDSLDQRWRDIEGHAYSRSRLPTSHLGSSDSLGRIMAQEV